LSAITSDCEMLAITEVMEMICCE